MDKLVFQEVIEDLPIVQFADQLRRLDFCLGQADGGFATVLADDLKALLDHIKERDHRVTWFTTCKNCSGLWEKVYQYDMERQELRSALEDMVWQHAYRTGDNRLFTGGLSSLEFAFSVLGWDDPYTPPAEGDNGTT